jgi:hypothetical protein
MYICGERGICTRPALVKLEISPRERGKNSGSSPWPLACHESEDQMSPERIGRVGFGLLSSCLTSARACLARAHHPNDYALVRIGKQTPCYSVPDRLPNANKAMAGVYVS